MSNSAIRNEASILFAWCDGGTVYGLQLLRDNSIAKVDEHLNVLETLTLEEARKLKADIGEDPDGYWGTPPEARFSLVFHSLRKG